MRRGESSLRVGPLSGLVRRKPTSSRKIGAAQPKDRLASRSMNQGGDTQRVLVTGAASGIGSATAVRLRAGGALVAGIDVNAVALPEMELQAWATADVALWTELEAAVDECSASLGGLDWIVTGMCRQ